MLTIDEICDRYDISRKTFYRRLQVLRGKDIDTNLLKHPKTKQSFVPEYLIDILDDFQRHVDQWNSYDTYQPVLSVSVVEETAQHETTQEDLSLPVDYPLGTLRDREFIDELAIAISKLVIPFLPPVDPTLNFEKLLTAEKFKLELTTSQIKQLIGVKPREKEFTRGSFVFIKCGKIGRQSAWKVASRK